MQLPDNIKKYRTEKNLSQKEVALSIGIDQAQYSRIESGKVKPTLTSLEKIANALAVKVGDLFAEEKTIDINSYNKSLVEKIKLIDQLDEKHKQSLFTFIDLAVTNQRFRENLNSLLSASQP